MRRGHSGARPGGRVHAGATLAAGAFALLLLSACSGGSLLGTSQAPAPSSSPSVGQQLSALFSGTSTASTASTAGMPVPGIPPGGQYDCPVVDVRPGASTYSVNAPGQEPSALSLRYQGTLGQTARECAFLGATMTVKVGIQGRVILGPAGSPGPVEIPLRLALVHEGPEPKPLWTKAYTIPLTIEPGQSSVPFTYIESDLTVPMPPPADLERYVIYVGFDPLALRERKPRPARR